MKHKPKKYEYHITYRAEDWSWKDFDVEADTDAEAAEAFKIETGRDSLDMDSMTRERLE